MLRVNIVLLLVCLIICSAYLPAQDLSTPPPPRKVPENLPMQSSLYELDRAITIERLSERKFSDWLRSRNLALRDDGRINIEIINQQGDSPLSAEIITGLDGQLGSVWGNRVSAWISPGRMIQLARALPQGFYMEKAHKPLPDDQGPGVTGSEDYRDNGADGTGITIGIIDGGYTGLTAAVTAGRAPADYTEVNYAGGTFEDDGRHGTYCVETVFDHAPEATYIIYKVGNKTDLLVAANHAILNDVDVISHSLSWYNTGWEDGTGEACNAAQTATNNGILFCTSAGNRAQQHWKGNYLDVDSDNWHDFSTGDETIQMTIPSDGSGTFYLCWNTAGGTYDFDLYLYDETLSEVLLSSTNSGNNFEEIGYDNSGPEITVHLAVFRNSGNVTEMEIFNHGSSTWQQHIVSASSTTSPSNSTSQNVISVAAVGHLDFESPSGTSSIIMDYSSRGPTNSGNQAPEISGPTNTTVSGFTVFTGTSCATPNIAGAAAAFWSSAPYLSATGIRWLLIRQAYILKDWGTPSTDYIYGYGGVQLHSYMDNTIWVDRVTGNLNGISSLPYYYLSDAQNAVTTPGRIVILESNYREPVTLNKANVRYEAVGDSVVLGE